jgi:hypothetical protein
MKKIIIPILFLIIATSCATIKVSHDFDKTAPFSSYKTYAYTADALALPIETLNKNRLLNACDKELALKGFTKSDNPDVFIDIKITGKEYQTATATSSGGGYGAGYGYHYGGGFSTTTINYDTYIEGTVFINMIEKAKDELVWQGRAVGTYDPDASGEKREKNINNGMKQIFANYPPYMK